MNKFVAVLFLGLAALMGVATPTRAAELMALKDASAVFNQWIAAYAAHDAEKIMAVFDKTLIASYERPVREGSTGRPDAQHRLLVARDDTKLLARRVGKLIRCRGLHAHGKIRRRHCNFLTE